MESESLPSSSPIRFVSSAPSSDGAEATVKPAASDDSSPLWRSVGPLPSSTRSPATVIFDDNEARVFEDGEVNEEKTPPSNQQQTSDVDRRRHLQDLDDCMGEQHMIPRRDPEPTHRKRSWAGSQGSEERARLSRRPRREEEAPQQPSLRLPPITEFFANPWGGAGGLGEARREFSMPVACSTPKNVSQYYAQNHHSMYMRSHSHLSIDSRANVSGHPPTPFSKANSTLESATSNYGSEHGSLASRFSHAATRDGQAEEEDMRVDREDEESSALLQAPSRPRRTQNQELASLRDVLADPAGGQGGEDERGWTGGYVPYRWNRSERGPNGQRRVPAVEDWGADDDRSTHGDVFSPIPHTKAWQYQQAQLRGQDERAQAASRPTEQTYNLSMAFDGQTAEPREQEAGRGMTRASSGAKRREPQTQDGVRGWRYGMEEETHMDTQDNWRDVEMVPTAVSQGPMNMDAPTVAENPRDRKWEVHFDDPESLVRGQSTGWQRAVWKDSTAVMFTAYNYRFTTNGVINRHVEAAVTTITTFVTGETSFNVAPPDPDQQKTLNVRDLPFTWVIRGLTAIGAARMIDVRVASSKGVSIITYPKRLGNPKWVCSLVGFLRPDTGVIRAAVMNVLQAPTMREWLTRMTRNSGTLRRLAHEERVDYVLSTLEVGIADLDDGDFMANIYMEAPTDDMTEWREWVAMLRTCRFNNFLNGTGVARKIYWCSGCRGVDHDTMKCLFPMVQFN